VRRFIIIMTTFIVVGGCFAQDVRLQASWYSVESLKREGTWAKSKGRCADGSLFDEGSFTCATRMFHIGSILRVYNISNDRWVVVRVTDRIGRRFAHKRIDLSKAAFARIADLKRGVINVRVEVVR
jgi:rare lipoprotein A